MRVTGKSRRGISVTEFSTLDLLTRVLAGKSFNSPFSSWASAVLLSALERRPRRVTGFRNDRRNKSTWVRARTLISWGPICMTSKPFSHARSFPGYRCGPFPVFTESRLRFLCKFWSLLTSLEIKTTNYGQGCHRLREPTPAAGGSQRGTTQPMPVYVMFCHECLQGRCRCNGC